MKPDVRCGTCKWWPAKLDKRGRRIVQNGAMHLCSRAIPDVALPYAVTKGWEEGEAVGFLDAQKYYTEHHEGVGCPTWEKMK